MRRMALLGFAAVAACHDVSGFTTGGDRYEGEVVEADFVRTGVDVHTSMCLTLDADHLQDVPGTISTSDGRFQGVALRPIPQIWHDPLSTLSFGEGRLRNLVYVAAQATDGADSMVVVSLMRSGDVEVRLIRSAPPVPVDGGAPVNAPSSLFAVFALARAKGPCSF